MNLPELVIFDMDGLIFDTEELFSQELGKVMETYGYRLTRENYVRTIGIARNDAERLMQEMYGKDYPFAEISALTRGRVNKIAADGGLVIKPGIKELLQFLEKQKIACCVASSSPQAIVTEYMVLAGIRKYFIGIFGGESVKRSKPAPDIFLAACAAYQVPPQKALVLEDSEAGILAALTGGIPVFATPDMKQPSQELAAQTLLTAPDAYEVAKFLNRLTISIAEQAQS